MIDKKTTLDNNNMDEFINSLKETKMNMSLEMEVLETYQKYLNAILNKDYATLNEILSEDAQIKMNGKISTKKDFIDGIETGMIEYKKFDIFDVNVIFLDDKVNLKCTTKTTADVFGNIGSWKDNTDINLKKINDTWVIF